MNTPATPPPETAAPAPAPPRSRFFRLPRRDFVFGGLAGLVAGKALERVQPLEWTQQALPQGTSLSFAQSGEDLVLSAHLDSLAIAKPSYLDIGAWEPIESNNTYLFYRRGGRGVLVEPNVALTPKLRKTRPGDAVLEAGIGVDDAEAADYYVTEYPQLNSFDKEQIERLQRDTGLHVERVVKMPLVNINRVIAEHFDSKGPDLISIDIEGLDLAILRTLDFARYRPRIICAETLITATHQHNTETAAFLATKGYTVCGMTFANTIFINRNA